MKILRVLLILAAGVGFPPIAAAQATTSDAGARKSLSPDAEGFIRNWVILEPIRLTNVQLTEGGVQTAVKHEYFDGQLVALPKDKDAVTANGTNLVWHAVAAKDYLISTYHFAYALGKPTSNVLFWGVTVVNCPREMKGVRLAIGCNASS